MICAEVSIVITYLSLVQ